jgi:hypothetical protein
VACGWRHSAAYTLQQPLPSSSPVRLGSTRR